MRNLSQGHKMGSKFPFVVLAKPGSCHPLLLCLNRSSDRVSFSASHSEYHSDNSLRIMLTVTATRLHDNYTCLHSCIMMLHAHVHTFQAYLPLGAKKATGRTYRSSRFLAARVVFGGSKTVNSRQVLLLALGVVDYAVCTRGTV
jgi:hypothetical protein